MITPYNVHDYTDERRTFAQVRAARSSHRQRTDKKKRKGHAKHEFDRTRSIVREKGRRKSPSVRPPAHSIDCNISRH